MKKKQTKKCGGLFSGPDKDFWSRIEIRVKTPPFYDMSFTIAQENFYLSFIEGREAAL